MLFQKNREQKLYDMYQLINLNEYIYVYIYIFYSIAIFRNIRLPT